MRMHAVCEQGTRKDARQVWVKPPQIVAVVRGRVLPPDRYLVTLVEILQVLQA